ncbi:MAG: ATP-binding protein [Bacteroidota bacterium]
MITRHIENKILEDLTFFPVVGIVGPRQVGKTTLAKSIRNKIDKETLLLDLELDSDLTKLEDAETYLKMHQDKCVIIDEIQRLPRLFPLLRALVDIKREPARFILLGSASPHLIKESSETLAGRIAYTELTPFSLLEIEESIDIQKHWLIGGFPESVLSPNDDFSWRWLQSFVQTFIERDLRTLGHDVSSVTLSRMLSMLGHVNGQLQNASEISRSLGVSSPTVKKYLDLLEGSFIINRLQPYFINVKKRLVKSPKLYYRDSGVLHFLLRINDLEQLLGHIAIGASWESYVLEQIRRLAGDRLEYFFYRTVAGAESDLVLISRKNKKICVEIKRSNAPKVSKGFYNSLEDLKPDAAYIITPNSDVYKKDKDIVVCDLLWFLKEELNKFI